MPKRFRSKNRKAREQEWERRMEDAKRQEEEERLNRQQRSMTKKSTVSASKTTPTGGAGDDRKIAGSDKTKKETKELKSTVSSPQNSRRKTASSPRFDAYDARNSDQSRRLKPRRKFSSDNDSDEGTGDIQTAKKTYKRYNTSSPARLKDDRKFQSDNDSDEDTGDKQTAKKTYKRYNTSSPARLKDDFSIRRKDESCNVSSPLRSSRLEYETNFDGRKPIARQKVSSSSRSTLPPGGSEPTDTATTAANNDPSDSDGSFNMLTAKNNDPSDSDGSFNMLSIFRQKKRNEKGKQESTKSEQADNPRRSRMNKPKKRSRSFSSSEDDDEEDEKAGGGNSLRRSSMNSRKKRSRSYSSSEEDKEYRKARDGNSRLRKKTKNGNNERFSSDDENSIYSGDKNRKRRRKSTSLRKQRNVQRTDSNDSSDGGESVLESDEDETRSSIRQHGNKKLTNHDNDEFSLAAVATGTNKKSMHTSSVDDDDDGFMSDCDPPPVPASRRRKENEAIKDRKRKARESAKGWYEQENQKDLNSDWDDDHDCEKGIENDRLDVLHPIFENPKFGPYEPMQPLLLSDDKNESVIQVPASLNRYLAPFQKEGVQFMYNCLARESGVILGDEMGCGKTVQVISLLCALFQKTGTRKDFIDIRDRNSLVRKRISKVQKLKDRALRMGEVFDENINEWKKSLSLSPWNPVMIIVPPTIMDTWKNAFKTFSHFSVSFYSGKMRKDALNSVLYGSADILIVPKSAFQDEKHLWEIQKVEWKLVVIDEFHNFKNHKAKISEHLRELKDVHQPLILGMTGTLMQNNHTELWNLIDLVETDYFGSKEEFKTNIDRPITLGRHKCADPSTKARSEAASAELRKGLNKIYIKREKNDVLKGQLPEKNEEFILCDLSPLQKEVYRHLINLPDFDLVKHGSRPCDCGINQNFFRKLLKLKGKAEKVEFMRENKSAIKKQSQCCKRIPENPRYGQEGEPFINQDAAIWRTLDSHCTDDFTARNGCDLCPWCCVLPCLTKLNKLSSHLGLLQASKTIEGIGSPSYIAYKKAREFAKVALVGVVDRLPGGDYDRSDGIMDDHFNLSGKLRVLNRLLKRYYDDKGKVLLFSHSTQSLDLIENWLKSRGSFEYRRMDGSTPISRRQQLTDEFNNSDYIFLFLLSIKATGLGLNLTSANRVIMFDVNWNPSWEIQAQDRAHRIGQTRNVHVVRLISKGTVEEMIYLRQIYKEHLKQDTLEEHDDEDALAPRVFRGVQGDKYRKGELFGTENLFRFKEDGSFLDDIFTIRPESRNRGNGDTSSLEIRDSGKLLKALLGMTDEEKKKIGEEDHSVILKALSEKDFGNRPTESSVSILQEESDSANKNQELDEPTDTKITAINHQDLFRSDRGEAAIKSGEDGFDEEMGGQTQAAYEIYENIKDNIPDELGNSDDDINPTTEIKPDICESHETHHMAVPTKEIKPDICESIDGARTMTVPTNEIKPDICNSIGVTQTTTVKRPTTASTPSTLPQTRSDGVNLSGGPITNSKDEASRFNDAKGTTQCIPKPKLERKPSIPYSAPAVQQNCQPELVFSHNNAAKKLDENSFRKSNENKNRVLLMGCTNVDNARTEFSAADLRRPEYGRKKKKKKKKKSKSNDQE